MRTRPASLSNRRTRISYSYMEMAAASSSSWFRRADTSVLAPKKARQARICDSVSRRLSPWPQLLALLASCPHPADATSCPQPLAGSLTALVASCPQPTTAPAAAVLGAAPCPQPPATLELAEATTSSPIPIAPEIAPVPQLEAMFKALISY